MLLSPRLFRSTVYHFNLKGVFHDQSQLPLPLFQDRSYRFFRNLSMPRGKLS